MRKNPETACPEGAELLQSSLPIEERSNARLAVDAIATFDELLSLLAEIRRRAPFSGTHRRNIEALIERSESLRPRLVLTTADGIHAST